MSRRAQVQRRLKMLDELGGVMAAMKNLSMMETVKLARLVDCQRRVHQSIAVAVSEFLHHYPDALPAVAPSAQRIVVAVGSQRGFCGEFNEAVIRALGTYRSQFGDRRVELLTVGRRLAAKLTKHPGVAATLEGASVVEEVPTVLASVLDALVATHRVDASAAVPRICVFAHRDVSAGVLQRDLWPPAIDGGHRLPYAPRLTLEPIQFGRQLIHHYLWTQLHGVFYDSLMAENRRRLQHMQGAMQRMDERREALQRGYDALRQEEITEEIEVILLGDTARLGQLGRRDAR